MYYNENDLNLHVKGTDKIVTNKSKSEFYNLKTGQKIKVVRNCRSFGIWNKRKFIPLSKIEIQEEQENNYSDDLINLLNQFKN
tara:strand:+ start:3435 stop:3683 length:249 start_codon:yes stop_codon:yes gene_type:complete